MLNKIILNDPSTSNWVKEQIQQLQKRDVVDVLNDLEVLMVYFNGELNVLMEQHTQVKSAEQGNKAPAA